MIIIQDNSTLSLSCFVSDSCSALGLKYCNEGLQISEDKQSTSLSYTDPLELINKLGMAAILTIVTVVTKCSAW